MEYVEPFNVDCYEININGGILFFRFPKLLEINH